MLAIQHKVPLAPFTTYKLGGNAEQFIKVTTNDELIAAVRYAQGKQIPYFILGSGANILISDDGFPGLVIKNEIRKFRIEHFGNVPVLRVSGGVTIDYVILHTISHGYGGFEHFAGIPSTIGGALWQNLHFLSPDRKSTVYLGDSLVQSCVFNTLSNTEEVLNREQFKFGYDTSILHEGNRIVLDSLFQLVHEKDSAILQKRVDANLAWRNERHPPYQTEFSCGSVFKKVGDVGAGRLIDQCGLKGFAVDGAMISPKHANFIINTGSATATSVRNLIAHTQKVVFQETGHILEPEVQFVGNFKPLDF